MEKIDENITIKVSSSPPANRVACVKAIRTLTGMGLKESLDLTSNSDSTVTLPVNQKFFVDPSYTRVQFEEACTALRNFGYEVGHPIHTILKELRTLAQEALDIGEDEVANEILQLVLAEKLRRYGH